MDWTHWLGFTLAAYAIVGNDTIQTIGTFLTSNSQRPAWLLWTWITSIFLLVTVYGWWVHGDVSYGRLSYFPEQPLDTVHLIPPLILLCLTRAGLPVSTTFLILSVFATKNIDNMVLKSVLGYVIAFIMAWLVYWSMNHFFKGLSTKELSAKSKRRWLAAQWLTTGFLWSQWLIQDLVNIFIFLPRQLSLAELCLALLILCGLLLSFFVRRGSRIQAIVNEKSRVNDVRSATFIDLIYGLILLVFKEISNMPMSTTWVFIGLLAGREMAIIASNGSLFDRVALGKVSRDLAKVTIGLTISVGVALFVNEVL